MAEQDGETQGVAATDTPADDAADTKPVDDATDDGGDDLAAANARIAELEKANETFKRDNYKLRSKNRELRADDKTTDGKADDDAPKGPVSNPLEDAVKRQAFVAEAVKQGVTAEAAEKFSRMLGAEAFADMAVDAETGDVAGAAEVVAQTLEAMPMLKNPETPPPAPGTTNDAPGSGGNNVLDALESREAFRAATKTDEGFLALVNNLKAFKTVDPTTGHEITWNLSPSPNEAHDRVRSAQRSTILDKLSGR